MTEQPRNALKTDLYELTMAAGYFHNGIRGRATFELFCHTLPPRRGCLLAAGLRQALDYVTGLQFHDEEIRYLRELPAFAGVDPAFFDHLRDLRFTGEVWAMREGEVAFVREPLLQVTAPIIQAQIMETYLLSVFNVMSLVASKAARVVRAAGSDGKERPVVDFGSRRAHGPGAGVLAAYAAYLAGCAGTSNVEAGKTFGIPVYGTMAHAWVQAFENEDEAFRAYHAAFPDNCILLIDTYDTIEGARRVVRMKNELKGKAVRLDSGDLAGLSREVRRILDEGGLQQVKIIASGNLNEEKIAALVKAKAPIDIFGVGTEMVTSRDAPALDLTYKLVQIEGADGAARVTAKHSPEKETLPGRKQVFRAFGPEGRFQRDTIAGFSEPPGPGENPLLIPVMAGGARAMTLPDLDEARADTAGRLERFPEDLLAPEPGEAPAPRLSPGLKKLQERFHT